MRGSAQEGEEREGRGGGREERERGDKERMGEQGSHITFLKPFILSLAMSGTLIKGRGFFATLNLTLPLLGGWGKETAHRAAGRHDVTQPESTASVFI
jgi:hypothetical protein